MTPGPVNEGTMFIRFFGKTRRHQIISIISLLLLPLVIYFAFWGNPLFQKHAEDFAGLVPVDWQLSRDGSFTGQFRNDLPYDVNITAAEVSLRNVWSPCTFVRVNGILVPPTGRWWHPGNASFPAVNETITQKIPVKSQETFTIRADCNIEEGTYQTKFFGVILFGHYWAKISLSCSESPLDAFDGSLFGTI